MRKLATAFLGPAERAKVLTAVHEAEKRTSAEIVLLIVGASDSYPKAELACGVAIGLVVGALVSVASGTHALWLFLVGFGGAALCGFEAAKRLPWLKKPFVSPERARHETLQAAQAAFYAHGLTKTRERNALLLYISVYEHLVFLLPDTGLAARLENGVLRPLADDLTRGLRQGRQAEALIATIGKLAELLAPIFPPRPDDTNEIEDLLLP